MRGTIRNINLHEEAIHIWSIIGSGQASEFWTVDESAGVFEPIEDKVNGYKWEEAESIQTLKSHNGIYMTLFRVKGYTTSIIGKLEAEFNYIEVWTATPQAYDPQDGGGDPVLFHASVIGSGIQGAFLEFYKETLACTIDCALEAAYEHEMSKCDFGIGG